MVINNFVLLQLNMGTICLFKVGNLERRRIPEWWRSLPILQRIISQQKRCCLPGLTDSHQTENNIKRLEPAWSRGGIEMWCDIRVSNSIPCLSIHVAKKGKKGERERERERERESVLSARKVFHKKIYNRKWRTRQKQDIVLNAWESTFF